jgi:hypothetical protein
MDGPEDEMTPVDASAAAGGFCFKSQSFEVSLFVIRKSIAESNNNADANPVIYTRTFDLTPALRWRLLVS